MVRKLTLKFKKTTCTHCDLCDKRALRKGWKHCEPGYKPRNGHCENFRNLSRRISRAAKVVQDATPTMAQVAFNIEEFARELRNENS